ncbi:unnamed protein product [Ixodes pacificus]
MATRRQLIFFNTCLAFGVLVLVLQFVYTKRSSVVESPNTQDYGSAPYFTADGAFWLDSWRQASPNVYLFSAYLDPRLGPNKTTIRVIGAVRQRPELKVAYSCLVDDDTKKRTRPIVAKMIILQEHHHHKFTGVFFLCPYSWDPSSEAPRTVRLGVSGAEFGTSQSVSIHNRPTTEHLPDHSLALCVRPFYDGVPKLHDLVHFVAYYSTHGVRRFTFYDNDSRPEVKDYLRTLSKHLQVDLISWNSPTTKLSWALYQNAFTQDCLYRHMHASKYVLIVDLDEFVFPFPKRDKPTRLVDILPSFQRSKSCFMFRNVFWIREASSEDEPFIFKSVQRSKKVWPPMLRTKYVARVMDVVEGGIHYCIKYLDSLGKNRHSIVGSAHMFHYKQKRTEQYTKDHVMLVWQDSVMKSPIMRAYLSRSTEPPGLLEELKQFMRFAW